MQLVLDSVSKSFINSTYAKEKVNIVFTTIVSTIVRTIMTSIFTTIFYTNIFYLDFFLGIFIPVIIALNTPKIYFFVKKFDTEIMYLTKYVIKNYSEDNLRLWRRFIVLSISIYYIIYLLIYEIKSKDIIFSIIQFITCYFLVDLIETRDSFLYKIYTSFIDRTKVKIYEKEFVIIEEYIPWDAKDKRDVRDVKKIEEEFYIFDEMKVK